METAQSEQPMDRRKKYYLTHRDTPEFKARIAKAKKAHYQRNRDIIKAKALQRYYELKGTIPPGATTDAADSESESE